MRILLTNDDGIGAPGMAALEAEFRKRGFEVLVVAPDRERSGASHSFTLRNLIRVEARGEGRIAVTGTPVDAVHLAVNKIFRDRRPDLVVSGINRGANLACDINYSGTVAAAREGAILGIPSFAISLDTRNEEADFGPSARFAGDLADRVTALGLEERTFLNVNLPDIPPGQFQGVKVTAQGIRNYDNIVHVMDDPFGNQTFWLGGLASGGKHIDNSDIVAVEDGYVSITPLRLDLTKRSEVGRLNKVLGNGAFPWIKS